MRVAIVGLGVQGMKRLKCAQPEIVCTIDPIKMEATHKSWEQTSNVDLDAAIICLPEDVKIEAIRYFLSRGCHVLVEKPLLGDFKTITNLKNMFAKKKLILQTGYNHRFEPHFKSIKKILKNQTIGDLYKLNMHYGNGTSELVKNSNWRDQDLGILTDIGSHLLDLIEFWFGEKNLLNFLKSSQTNLIRNEIKSFDSFSVSGKFKNLHINISGSYLNWKNRFFLELIGSNGSIEMNGLCKWGPSELSIRRRVRPAGIPKVSSRVLNVEDPTWKLEYENFKSNCDLQIKLKSNLDLILNSYFDNVRKSIK